MNQYRVSYRDVNASEITTELEGDSCRVDGRVLIIEEFGEVVAAYSDWCTCRRLAKVALAQELFNAMKEVLGVEQAEKVLQHLHSKEEPVVSGYAGDPP